MKVKARRRIAACMMIAAVLTVGNLFLPADIGLSLQAGAEAVTTDFLLEDISFQANSSKGSTKTKLTAPTGIKTTSTSNSVTISWNKVSGADGYRIYRLNTETLKWGKWKSVTETTVTADKLSANKNYYFKVAAVADGKAGEQTDKITVKTKSALPSAPSAGYTGLASYNGDKYYFLNGEIFRGQIDTPSGSMYFDMRTYKMVTGWEKSWEGDNKDPDYYYYDKNGIMLKNGTYTIDGKKYTFDSKGRAKAVASGNTVSTTKKVTASLPVLPNPEKYGFKNDIESKNKYMATLYTSSSKQGATSLANYDMALKSNGFEIRETTTDENRKKNMYTYELLFNGEYYGLYTVSMKYDTEYDYYLIVILVTLLK